MLGKSNLGGCIFRTTSKPGNLKTDQGAFQTEVGAKKGGKAPLSFSQLLSTLLGVRRDSAQRNVGNPLPTQTNLQGAAMALQFARPSPGESTGERSVWWLWTARPLEQAGPAGGRHIHRHSCRVAPSSIVCVETGTALGSGVPGVLLVPLPCGNACHPLLHPAISSAVPGPLGTISISDLLLAPVVFPLPLGVASTVLISSFVVILFL
jgi:hypothetical protein